MASARSRSAVASSNDVETRGSILRGNSTRREAMNAQESMKLMISIAVMSGPIQQWAGFKG